jgi:DNA mismatch repair protein MutS
MSHRFPRIINVNVSVKEIQGQIVFLRKLAEGGSNHSFGIHVAQLAGMPKSLIARANEVLKSLEAHRQDPREEPAIVKELNAAAIPGIDEGFQMSFFQLDDPALEAIRDQIIEVDIDRLTPIEALMKLHEIKASLTGKKEASGSA